MTQTENHSSRKLRVLIADDVQETRRNTRLMLSMIADVELAAIAMNGVQMLQMAKEGHPDIVITDINMPEMDGLTASRELFKIYPDIGCIIMSSEKDITTVRTAMSIGVQEYLIKPFSIDELETAIANVKKRIVEMRQRLAQATHLSNKSEIYLKQLAEEYARTRRTDDQALDVFEQLAANPGCELRWLRTLAMIYIIRQEWGKLKFLAARLEQQTQRK